MVGRFQLVTYKGSHMTRYEILLLATPTITEDEVTGFEKQFEKLVNESKGNVLSFEKWGKCRLAYPIKHHEYGIYYLARFQMDNTQTFLKEIKLLLDVKYHELIMRNAVVKIKDGQSLDYQRPATVEDMPTRNVDDFLRENKMEGLLPSLEKTRNTKSFDEDDMDEEALA